MSSIQGLIEQAFGEKPQIKKRSFETLTKYPELEKLFEDIAKHIINLSSVSSAQGHQPPKKRKLDNGVPSSEEQPSGLWKPGSFSTMKELSFTVPQRKKFNLDIGDTTTGLRVSNPMTSEVEFEVDWRDIAQLVCLPMPEKAQAQYSFCLFPVNGDGITKAPNGVEIPEQLLWTVPNSTPKSGICSMDITAGVDKTYKSITVRLLNDRLKQIKGQKCQVVEPDTAEFVSETARPYKKGEKAVHVKAFRGNKDGFLFFLSTGILWGFKKPLVFFSFDSIDSVSYTSVLQRTFNLNIGARGSGANSEPQEFEFSMIDQAEFAGIDVYVKRHQLQDASMAEQRRAKKLNVNGVKGVTAVEDQEEGPGELEKAAQELGELEDDDEEDDDENFDPGSEGESEGSGTSDEEGEEDTTEPTADANEADEDDTI